MEPRRTILFAVPVAALMVVGCSSTPTIPAQTVTRTVTASTSPPAATTITTSATPAPAGQEVRDGDLAFSVSDHAAFREEGPLNLYLFLTVGNVGMRPATFNAGYQILIDTRGREYSVSEVSSIDFKEAGVFQLNPGLKSMILLKFRVPTDFEPSQMTCRGSANSPGIALAVTVAAR